MKSIDFIKGVLTGISYQNGIENLLGKSIIFQTKFFDITSAYLTSVSCFKNKLINFKKSKLIEVNE